VCVCGWVDDEDRREGDEGSFLRTREVRIWDTMKNTRWGRRDLTRLGCGAVSQRL
jgi:hypothetical protein